VIQQTSQLSSISVHTLIHKLKVTAAIAALSSQKSAAKWEPTVPYISILDLPQKEKIKRVKLGKCDGQVIGPSLSILECGGALSCWNSMSLEPSSFKTGMRN
jgi:hypothetical protein